jgi:hypothetical protein
MSLTLQPDLPETLWSGPSWSCLHSGFHSLAHVVLVSPSHYCTPASAEFVYICRPVLDLITLYKCQSLVVATTVSTYVNALDLDLKMSSIYLILDSFISPGQDDSYSLIPFPEDRIISVILLPLSPPTIVKSGNQNLSSQFSQFYQRRYMLSIRSLSKLRSKHSLSISAAA